MEKDSGANKSAIASRGFLSSVEWSSQVVAKSGSIEESGVPAGHISGLTGLAVFDASSEQNIAVPAVELAHNAETPKTIAPRPEI